MPQTSLVRLVEDDFKGCRRDKPVAEFRQFAEDVWIVEGPDVRDMEISFTTRMSIVKLANGSLLVDSPVPVPSDMLERITRLGPVRYLVAATPRHVWRLASWHDFFPETELWACKSTPFASKKGNLAFTGTLTDQPLGGWADDLNQVAF